MIESADTRGALPSHCNAREGEEGEKRRRETGERERGMGEEREGENIKHILGLRGGAAVHVHKGALITSHDTRKGEEEEREGRW